MKTEERAQFFYEIAKLLKASVPFHRALEILARQRVKGRVPSYAEELGGKLSGNVSVADAFASHRNAVAMEVDLVRAGERAGRLAAIFAHLAAYYARVVAAEKKIRGSLRFPVLLAHVVVLLGVVPFVITGFDASLAAWVCVKLVVLWCLLLGVARGFRILEKWTAQSCGWDRWFSAVPVVGGVWNRWVLARFASVFETGVSAGLLVTESLDLAAAASGSAIVRESASRAVALIQSGKNLGEALEETGVFPPAFIAAVATAEHAGSLDEEMARLASYQWEEADRAVQAMEEWIPRLGYGLVSAWMLFRVLSAYLAYFQRFNLEF